MMVEKIARRPLTIGAVCLAPGDVLTSDLEAQLPPGRAKVLVAHGWLSERPVVTSDVSDLTARLDGLEARLNALEARRGPGRPRKVENDGI